MISAWSDPLVITAAISTTGLAVRAGFRELRWWLALHDTSPGDRPAIIHALRTPRTGGGRATGYRGRRRRPERPAQRPRRHELGASGPRPNPSVIYVEP